MRSPSASPQCDEKDLPFGPNERSWDADGNHFEVRTLDLNRSFDEISAQLYDVLEAL